MKKLLINTIILALLIYGIAPGFSKVTADAVSPAIDTSHTNGDMMEDESELFTEPALHSAVIEESDTEMTVSANLKSDGLSVDSDMYFNTATGEMTLAANSVSSDGEVLTQNFDVFFNDIQGEQFSATLIDQNTGDIHEVNTIDAQASALPALVIGIVLKEGAKWAIKKYGPRLLISTFSRAAISAAVKNVSKFAVSNKHLSNAGGNYRKFDTTSKSKINDWIKEGLQAKDIDISVNDNDKLSFVITVNLGKKIGTKGETKIKIVIGYDGKIWTSYPIA